MSCGVKGGAADHADVGTLNVQSHRKNEEESNAYRNQNGTP